MSLPNITHVFVLMLENRSFDHMLGFSGITGTDAVTGQPTSIDGLTGNESNSYGGQTYPVTKPADDSMPMDPAHEFPDVLEQLCGAGAEYTGGVYPSINNSGFVSNYVASGGGTNPGEIMKCFDPTQLPVLVALANEFAVCDSWFSSMPGPTWPNRFFAMAGTAGGLDKSPTDGEIADWTAGALFDEGFEFQNGSIFEANLWWRIYAGVPISCIAEALQGSSYSAIENYSGFSADVNGPIYAPQFTFIEPNYGNVTGNYENGTSQHPLDTVISGEELIKETYEALRSSSIWNNSLLIITWDEHGGFYDHVAPPAAGTPGDTPQMSGVNEYGFNFEQYGVRVPAVVVSPLIPQNLIDHRLYDHSSVLASVEALFSLSALTNRDAAANTVLSLASLPTPRVTPMTLPNPAQPTVTAVRLSEAAANNPIPPAVRPNESIDMSHNLPGFLYVAMRADLDMSPAAEHPGIVARVRKIRTRAQARDYMESVRVKAANLKPVRVKA